MAKRIKKSWVDTIDQTPRPAPDECYTVDKFIEGWKGAVYSVHEIDIAVTEEDREVALLFMEFGLDHLEYYRFLFYCVSEWLFIHDKGQASIQNSGIEIPAKSLVYIWQHRAEFWRGYCYWRHAANYIPWQK